MVEAIDAMEAVKFVDIGDRSALKAALGATLVKNARHYEAFDVAFEVFFAHHREKPDRPGTARRACTARRRGSVQRSVRVAGEIDELVEALFRAIMGGDQSPVGRAGRRRARAVEELAGIEPGVRSAAPTTCIAPCGASTWTRRDCWSGCSLGQAGDGDSRPLETRLPREEVDAPNRPSSPGVPGRDPSVVGGRPGEGVGSAGLYATARRGPQPDARNSSAISPGRGCDRAVDTKARRPAGAEAEDLRAAGSTSDGP